MRIGIWVCAALFSNTAAAQESFTGNFLNLSFTGDGTTLSGAQLLESSMRQAQSAQFAASGSDKGDATYSIPIEVPPAILQPSVSLNYNSSGGHHNWVARGWSLSHGQVSITRIIGKERDQAYRDVDSPHRISGGGFDGIIWLEEGVWRYSSSGSVEASIEYVPADRAFVVSRNGLTTNLLPANDIDWDAAGTEPVEWFPVYAEDAKGNGLELSWSGRRLTTIEYGFQCEATANYRCSSNGFGPELRFSYVDRFTPSAHWSNGVEDVRDQWLDRIRVRGFDQGWSNNYLLDPVDEPDRPTFVASRGRLLGAVYHEGRTHDDNRIQRLVARMSYAEWETEFTPFIEPGVAPPSLSYRTTSPQAFVGDDGFTVFNLIKSETYASTHDQTGDGLPDALLDTSIVPMERDPGVDGPASLYFRDPDVEPGWDPTGYDHPVTVTGFCSRTESARYTTETQLDVDGDGLLDRIVSLATPLIIDGPDDDHCGSNRAPATTVWTIHYGTRDGFEETGLPVDAPFQWPSIGKVSWTSPTNLAGYVGPEPTVPRGKRVEDGRVELMDIDGNGFLDLVEVVEDDIRVYPHSGQRGGGWSDTPVSWFNPSMAGAVHAHTVSVQYNSQVSDGVTSFNGFEYEVFTGRALETWTMSGFRDLNGDGLQDFVVACDEDGGGPDYWWCGSDQLDPNQGEAAPSTWTVWFNTRDGFTETPHAWGLPTGVSRPIVGLSRVDEGANTTLSCSAPTAPDFQAVENQAEWFDPGGGPENDGPGFNPRELDGGELSCSSFQQLNFEEQWATGRGQRVMASLMDFDGDGLQDYVDAHHSIWYRNLGDRFDDSPTTMPAWMPNGITESWGYQIVFADTDVPPGTFPVMTASSGVTRESYRLEDFNRDGMPDVVLARDYTDDQGLSVLLPKGVQFGQYPKPGMLESIEIETGAVTTLDYTPSTEMWPAGLFGTDDQGDPIVQRMATSKDLLTSMEIFDPVTEQGAARHFDYEDGLCIDGVCQGFARRIVENFKWNEDILSRSGRADGLGVLLSSTETTYLRSRDYLVPREIVIRTDGNRSHLPGATAFSDMQRLMKMTNIYAQDPNDFGASPVPNLWLKRRKLKEWAEDGPGNRRWKIDVRRNAVGLPTRVTHTPVDPADTEDIVKQHTKWVSSADGTLYRPKRQYTEAWDAAQGAMVIVEEGRFSYDGLGFGQVSDGYLTLQEVCSSAPGSAICDERLEWDFERTDRGSVMHTVGRDGTYVFVDDEVLEFTFGEAIPAKTRNAVGHITEQAVDGLGRVTWSSDINGVQTSTVMDSFGRPFRITRTSPDGHSEVVSETVYQTLTVPNHTSQTLFNSDGVGSTQRTRHEVYDGLGGMLQAWEPNVDGSGFIVTDTVSDVYGNALTTSEPYTLGAFATSTPANLSSDYVQRAYYDGMGITRWSTTDIAPIPAITLNPAPGETRTIDGVGLRKEQVADTHGRLVAVREGTGSNMTLTGQYTYDGRGRIHTFTDANTNQHRYEYDGAGRLRNVYRDGASADPELDYWSYEYDGPYPVQAYEGAARLAIDWEYDAIGRTTQKKLYNDSGRTDTFTWVWDQISDADGNRQWNGVRHAVTDPAGTAFYYYDETTPFGELGRLTSVTRNNPTGTPISFDYTYDLEGRTTSTVWPTGVVHDMQYTATGWNNFQGVTLPDGSIGVKMLLEYDDRGLLALWDETNSGVFSEINRSSPNRLDAVSFVHGGTGQDATLEYTYQDNGWLQTKRVLPPFGAGEYLEYKYDRMGRATVLKRHSNTDTNAFERYRYDDAGNLTFFKQGIGSERRRWEYDPPDRFGEIPRRVDTRTGDVDEHTWDPVTGRMTAWTSFNSARDVLTDRQFHYDGAGRLVQIDRDGELTDLFYDVDDNAVYEERGGEIYERFQAYRKGPDDVVESISDVIRVVTTNGTPEVKFSFIDVDGHAVMTWNADGTERHREITGLYGAPLVGSTWNAGATWEVDGLHGSEPDRKARVVHHGKRHSLFDDGRWLQPEPLVATPRAQEFIDAPGGASSVYAGAKPTYLQDRSGRYPFLFAAVLRCMSGCAAPVPVAGALAVGGGTTATGAGAAGVGAGAGALATGTISAGTIGVSTNTVVVTAAGALSGAAVVLSTDQDGADVQSGANEASQEAPNLDALSGAAGAPAKGGLTKAGHALDKHGGRAGSAFDKPTGNVNDKNAQGQQVVDDILTDPKGTTNTFDHPRHGEVTEIRASDGRGVRYDSEGEMIGLVEP